MRLAVAVLAAAALSAALPPAPVRLPDGAVVTPWGHLLRLGTLPESLAVSPDGRLVAVSDDGVLPDVRIVDLASARTIQTLPVKAPFYGLAWNSRGLAVSDGGQDRILWYSRRGDRLAGPAARIPVDGYPAGLAFDAGGDLLAASSLGGDLAVISHLGSGLRIEDQEVGPLPFSVAADARGVVVCNRNGGSVTIAAPDGVPLAEIPVGREPAAVAMAGRLAYVADANSDAISVVDVVRREVRATWPVRAWKGAPLGAMPSALAVDRNRLYVALSGVNVVAVLDRRTGRELFEIPTAWYPSAVAVTGKTLLIAAAKGLGSGPSDRDPDAVKHMPGLLEWGPVPRSDSYRLSPPVRQDADPAGLPAIRHVVFIMRENRSYDQDLGDWGGGDGDPQLADFGRMVTPNTHALASQFATSDQYYAAGEVSAQGHQWLLGGICSDYVERLWPTYLRGHPYDAQLPQGNPPAGMILEDCLRHGLSARMYGAELTRGPDLRVLRILRGAYDPAYTGWNLHVPDALRATQWEAEFKKGIFPRFEFIWLPDDHTAGFAPGYPSPRSMVADNDQALGRILSDLSHAPSWGQTVVFVAEDDAQGGQDHLDAHRSVMLAVGPWIRRGFVDHRAFSQPALFHTVLALLGLPPMTTADAAAPVLTEFFARRPDLRPYEAIAARISTTAMNPDAGPLARRASELDLARPDADDGQMADMLAEQREEGGP